MKKKRFHLLVIVIIVLISYADTLHLHYALDDRLVIFQNDYTLRGWDGIEEVMTEDGFSGYFGKGKNLVAGGRYRPLAQLTFILEYELFGKSIRKDVGLEKAPQNEELFIQAGLPYISHAVNLLLYLLLSILIYCLLARIFPQDSATPWFLSLPFIATLLFAVHPLHTEAVANIKGRDEILSMLGGILMIWFVLRYMEKRNFTFLLISFFSMSLGLFAKENAITFLAIIPLVLFYIPNSKTRRDWFYTLLPSLLATGLFLFVRYQALGAFMSEDQSGTILNNPFLHSTTGERVATVILTWGIYLKLMLFPHPLTHDYYPKQIAITDFSNPLVILLLLFFVFVVVYAIIMLRKKSIFSFGVLFFVITFSIVSNLFFNVGTFLNERFLFTPLLGFTILISHFILKMAKSPLPKKVIPLMLVLLVLLYSGKSIARNLVWKNDYTLFTTDVKVSSNSIKCNVSAGGSYLNSYKKNKKEKEAGAAENCLKKALELDPYSVYAHQLLGELYYFKERYDLSYLYYKNAAALRPDDPVMQQNMILARDALHKAGLKEAEMLLRDAKPQEALQAVNLYLQMNEATAEAYNLKGKIYGMELHQLDSALYYLQKAHAIDPEHFSTIENLGVAYAIKGDYRQAQDYLLKAHEMHPENSSVIKNLIQFYSSHGNIEKADEYRGKLSQ